MTESEDELYFSLKNVEREDCETICRFSVNCFGWEYKNRGAMCAIWHGCPINEYLGEADAYPGADCYIKYQGDDENLNSDVKKKQVKRNTKHHEKKNKNNINIFNIDHDNHDNDAFHPCQVPCTIYSDSAQGNQLFGFDCTNNRGVCVPGLSCQPSPLNGSDRWTCQ